MVHTKRVYESAAKEDGTRILVERLWPRGIRKEALPLDAWCKEVAPSPALRQWFRHDPEKWNEFERRYRAELDANPGPLQPLLKAARHGPLTLLYSSRDTEHNNARVLQAYLQEQLANSKIRAH
jgi:uncharacterized protein YeaO (DUF488 family)